MALTSKEIEAAYREGRRLFRSWSKAPTQTTASGIWFDLSMSPGNPFAQYYFATPLTATALKRSTDGGLDHGPDLGTGYQKFLHRFEIQTITATAAPLTLEILDYLAFYPGVAMDVGTQTLTTNITIPRQTNGRGVQMMVIEQNPYIGDAQFQVTYRNQDGVSGQKTPVVTCNTQIAAGTIATSATAQVGATGRFLPLASGDSGVQYPESIEFFSSDVGLLAIVLVAPVAAVTIFETTRPNYYDLWQDFALLPQIQDDAYLNMIALPVGTLAGANISGNLTTIWSAT